MTLWEIDFINFLLILVSLIILGKVYKMLNSDTNIEQIIMFIRFTKKVSFSASLFCYSINNVVFQFAIQFGHKERKSNIVYKVHEKGKLFSFSLLLTL